MTGQIPYLHCKDAIRRELVQLAIARKTIFYSELSIRLNGDPPTQGPWKQILDLIGREERALGNPDLTYIVINKRYKLPGQIEFEEAKPPAPQQRARAKQEINRVFARYAK